VNAASASEGELSADSPSLLDHELIFVTGKGGVGKTTIAAGLARVAAMSGRRTLICEMDAKGDLASALGMPADRAAAVGFEPVEVHQGLWVMTMNTEDSLREYLRLFLRVPLLGRIGSLANIFDFVATAAPGVKEILAVGKVCHEVRQKNYDLVIVDAEASGHIVAQIGAPLAIRDLVSIGPITDQTEWMSAILTDPARTAVVAVTTPEEMAVNETVELAERLRTHAEVELSMVVANRILPAFFDRRRLELLERIRTLLPAQSHWGSIVHSATTADMRRRVGARHLEDLRSRLAAVEMIIVPEIAQSHLDMGAHLSTLGADPSFIDAVSEALASELDAERTDA
jgi:anion-transporting  ArsA/GET3 family ATPase